MKVIITILITIFFYTKVTAQGAASQFTDDLLPQKSKMLAKYIPMNGTGFLYRFYAMPVNDVENKLNEFKKELQPHLESIKDADLKVLKEKDLYFYEQLVMNNLASLYGMDSLGMKNMEKLITEKKGDPNFNALVNEAQKKLFVKTLQPEERKRIMDNVYTHPELNNEALFKRSGSYRQWVGDYITYLRNTKYRPDTTLGYNGMSVVKLKVANNEIPAGFIKDFFVYQYTKDILSIVRNQKAKDDAYEQFMASAVNSEYKAEVSKIYDNIRKMNSQAPSPIFNYAGVDGKNISLKDLRGKYVYIDVWATWCAPCKAEIPFLQKVEHDYEGKNIHFVSLSVDKMADKNKWMKFVKDNKLGGIQVMADKDFSSDFIKEYNINAIPRFILIDPAGNIVSGDAKRPSDPLLRNQFDQLLK